MSGHESRNGSNSDPTGTEPQTLDALDQLLHLLARDVAKRLNANADQARVAAPRSIHASKAEPAAN